MTEVDEIRNSHLDSRIYIFVADGMAIGGIETLLVRMANQIAGLGYYVVVVAHDGPCMQSLKDNVAVFKTKKGIPLSTQLKSIPLPQQVKCIDAFIWAATPYSLVSIFKFQQYLFRTQNIKSVAVSGIFGPARSITGIRHRYDMLEHLLVLGWLPTGSVYFMSNAVQHTYVEQFGAKFAKWPIHRLALDKSDLIWRSRTSNRLRIVSVGRITSFKPYNFGALDVVESLLAENISLQWDIWGHGDQSDLLEQTIRERGLSPHISFHGALPYSRFTETVLQADLFVGMGTASLEAAQLGIPTAVALAWSKLGTYGFLHQCPADSIGESYVGASEANLIDLMRFYSNLSAKQRVEIGMLCRDAVSKKTGDERPPFDAIFETGIKYPSNCKVLLQMKTFHFAQNIWVLVKTIVFFSKSFHRSARIVFRGR